MTRSVISHVKKLSEINPFFTEEMRLAMINAPGPGTVADFVAFALTLPKADAQDFLETLSVKTDLRNCSFIFVENKTWPTFKRRLTVM